MKVKFKKVRVRPHGKRIWDILLDMKQTRNIASVV